MQSTGGHVRLVIGIKLNMRIPGFKKIAHPTIHEINTTNCHKLQTEGVGRVLDSSHKWIACYQIANVLLLE